ncbi:Hypothetical protein, partial CDS, partial [Neorhizobium galegae bv. officinalis]
MILGDLSTAHKDRMLAPLLSETLRRAVNLQRTIRFRWFYGKPCSFHHEPIELCVNSWISLHRFGASSPEETLKFTFI